MGYSKNIFYKSIPYIVWTLVISIGYAFLVYHMNVESVNGTQYSVESYYIKGLFISIPLVIFGIGVRKVKNIGRFLLLGVVVCFLSYTIMASICFTIITVLIWIARFFNRMGRNEGSLDGVHGILLVIFFIYIVFCGLTEDVFLQKMAMYHFIFAALLIFTHFGLHRFEEYIKIRYEKANMPSKRILDTGMRIFVAFSILVLLFVLPIIKYQYEFISFTLPEGGDISVEGIFETESEEGQQQMDMSEMFGEENENAILKVIWEFLEKLIFFVFYVGMAYIIVRTIYKIIVTFNQVEFEKNDKIESSVVVEDEIVKRQNRKKKFEQLFDFSKDMMIRRRYKKELKKYKPKNWQTPSEMEEMANLEIPELHQLYEKVRYGKK